MIDHFQPRQMNKKHYRNA